VNYRFMSSLFEGLARPVITSFIVLFAALIVWVIEGTPKYVSNTGMVVPAAPPTGVSSRKAVPAAPAMGVSSKHKTEPQGAQQYFPRSARVSTPPGISSTSQVEPHSSRPNASQKKSSSQQSHYMINSSGQLVKVAE